MATVSFGGEGGGGISTIPTLTGEQSDLLKQLLSRISTMVSEGLGAGPAGVLGAGESTLTEALAGLSPEYMADYFRTQVAPPQTRMFEEDVIPQLREEMVATGDFWGTPRVDIIEEARQKQSERMEAQMADWMRWGRETATGAIPYVPGIAGAGQALELERIGAGVPYVGMPTRLAYGEASVDPAIASALRGVAAGGGGGGGGSVSRPSGYGGTTAGGTSSPFYTRPSTTPTFGEYIPYTGPGIGDGIKESTVPPLEDWIAPPERSGVAGDEGGISWPMGEQPGAGEMPGSAVGPGWGGPPLAGVGGPEGTTWRYDPALATSRATTRLMGREQVGAPFTRGWY